MCCHTCRNFGFFHLYRGLDAKLAQSVVAAGFMFLTYEKTARAVFAAFGIARRTAAAKRL